MKSKDYLSLLLNEYENKELSKEDLKSTLKHFADLYHNEKVLNDNIEQDFKSSIKTLDYLIDFYEITTLKELKEKIKNLFNQLNNFKQKVV